MNSLETEKTRESEFQSLVEHLETAAGTPLVSGEMEHWLRELELSLAQLEPAIERRIRESHVPQIGSIKREDPEMLRHVETLQTDDAAIMETVNGLRARAAVLRPMVQRIEPDEKRAETALAELSEQGLRLVTRIRKQEIALRTWLQEAFTRDRGVVD